MTLHLIKKKFFARKYLAFHLLTLVFIIISAFMVNKTVHINSNKSDKKAKVLGPVLSKKYNKMVLDTSKLRGLLKDDLDYLTLQNNKLSNSEVYSLTGYAYDKDDNLLNNGNPLELIVATQGPGYPLSTTSDISLSIYKLTHKQIDILLKDATNCKYIKLVPKKGSDIDPKYTGYMGYEVFPADPHQDQIGSNKDIVRPSPPDPF